MEEKTYLEVLCENEGVDLKALMGRLKSGAENYGIGNLNIPECNVVLAALEVAGEM